MPNDATIHIKGMKEALANVRTLQDLRPFKHALLAGGRHVKGKLVFRPPAPSGPGPYPAKWYERNYGPKWALKGGGVHGRRTSENLGKKWGIKTRHRGLTVAIGNVASYARYVHDKAKQTRVHARTGWKTVQDVSREEAHIVSKFVIAYVNAVWKR